MGNIKQNLFWAFICNTTLIPVAAGVLFPFFGILLNPILAAAAMGLSFRDRGDQWPQAETI